MQSIIQKALMKCFIVCLMLSLALPTHAASLDSLMTNLQTLQTTLTALKSSMLGQVISGTTITVSNDQELFDALSVVKGGETIALKPGTYSAININPGFWKFTIGSIVKKDFASNFSSLTAPVTLTSADLSNRATMTTLRIYGGAKDFRFENLSFRPQSNAGDAVELSGNNITFTRNDISYGDSTNWSAADWNAKAGNAINANGTNIDISYNYVKNVNFGINGGTGSHVHHNKVENFIGDGLRGWDNSTFDNNIVMNPYSVNDNHIDGFQSFASNGVAVKNVTLKNNTIFAEPSTNPLRSGMQGIGLFDDPYENWVIENNLVLVDHGHGITMNGARTLSLQNNVALTPTNTAADVVTWIMAYPGRDGTQPMGVTYKNNYANTVMTTTDGNVKVPFSDYSKYFADPAKGDFTFKASAVPFPVGAVIDTAKLAPEPYKSGGSTQTTPAPTVTLAASASSVETGKDVTLTWSSTNATACTANGDWSGTKSTSGSEKTSTFTSAGTKTFTLSCTGTGGSNSKTITVSVTNPTTTSPAPTVTLSTSASSAVTGSAATLTWSSTDATACTASGSWSGTKATSGSESTGTFTTAGTKTYMLTCTGSGGSTAKTASISITADTTPGTGFKIGDRIQTKNNVNVRTEGLISSATLIGVNPTGSIGTIKEGPTVSTDIYGTVTWFKIDFDAGFDGWVGADNYTLVTSVPPTLTFTASASSVASGGNATLTWSSTGATLCTAGGSWSGTKATSGSESTGSLTTVGSKMFTLYCTGAGGSITKNVTIEVTSGSGTGTTTVSTRVMANTNVNVRQTPGGLKIGLQYMGATGTQGTQAPVTAKNNTWVYVDFDSGIDGYVAQQYLTVIKTQTSSDVQAQIDNLMKQLAVLQALLAQLQALEQ